MKIFSVLLIALIAPLAIAQTDVGKRLPSAQIPKKNPNQCAATPSQTYACLQNVTIDGVRYAVVGYDQQTGFVKYLHPVTYSLIALKPADPFGVMVARTGQPQAPVILLRDKNRGTQTGVGWATIKR